MITGGKIPYLTDYAQSQNNRGSVAYGIIILSTQRVFKHLNRKYVTVVKIVDHTWNQQECPKDLAPAIKVMFNSFNKDDVPSIRYIGTMIKLKDFFIKRVNDAKCGEQIFMWEGCVSRKNWEFVTEAREEVKELVKFKHKYFKETFSLDVSGDLENGKDMQEFTTVAKLMNIGVKIEENGNKLLDLKVADHKTKAHVILPYNNAVEYDTLNVGCIMLLRGARYKTGNIELTDNGNLMIIPYDSLVAKKFYELTNFYTDSINNSFEKSFTISKVLDESLPITSLSSILNDATIKNRYRTKVLVLEVGPKNIYDWVKGYCITCHKSFPLTKDDRETLPLCLYCGDNAKSIFQVQLFVQEPNAEEIYRLLVYTYNNKGEEFFDNEQAKNLYKSSKLHAKLKELEILMKKYGVYLDCIIERFKDSSDTYFQVVDTIIGLEYIKELITPMLEK